MSDMSQEYFARRLVLVHDYFHAPDFNVEHYSNQVMQAFIFYGSETPDNLNCFKAIHYGAAPLPESYYTLYGFKLRDKPVFVQQVMSVVQKLPIPQTVQEVYPDLTQDEWDAAIFTAVKVIQAFSPRTLPGNREPGWNVSSEFFARRLWSIYDIFGYPDFDVAKFNYRIMDAYLEFHWNNPDNERSHKLIEYGQARPPHFENFIHYGFKIKGRPILVVDILNSMESSPVPEKVTEAFPDLQADEWSSLMRMATISYRHSARRRNSNRIEAPIR